MNAAVLLRRISLPLLCPLLVAFGVSSVVAVEKGPYSLEILVGGVPLSEYVARGTTYVEALEDREYSIRLRNHTGERIAVALTVDGLGTIDGKVASARDATKWIVAPYQTITLDGWQTGSTTARRFFFTTEERSYGAWMGETANLGLIAAAVFREKPRALPIERMQRPSRPAPSAKSEGQSRSRTSGEASGDAPRAEADLDDGLAATGIGREVAHRVRRVEFEAEASPAVVLEVRYEYADALAELGVRPWPRWRPGSEPLARRERARGFADGPYAPDPYRTDRR